jgi:REP element-mobilizing transposase RayT
MSHFVEGCQGFAEDSIKTDFLDRLRSLVDKDQLRVHAWALMSNHYHIVVEPLDLTLSISLHKLLTGFACAFNRRKNRRGHVFDARFRSILVEKESYFLKLLAYVNLNPLRAGIVGSLEDLNEYPWTGHSAIIGKTDCPWLSMELTTTMLTSSPGESWRKNYCDLLSADLGEDASIMDSGNFCIGSAGLSKMEPENDQTKNRRSIRILGSKAFALERYEQYRSIRGAGLRERRKQHEMIESVLHEVAQEFQLPTALIRSGGRGETLSFARKMFVIRLIIDRGFTQADVASFLRISQSAISQMLKSYKNPSEDSF